MQTTIRKEEKEEEEEKNRYIRSWGSPCRFETRAARMDGEQLLLFDSVRKDKDLPLPTL